MTPIEEKLAKGNSTACYRVKIKPNIHKKAKWYYGYLVKERDMTGKEVIVYDVESTNFPDTYSDNKWGGTMYFSKDDCEILEKIY